MYTELNFTATFSVSEDSAAEGAVTEQPPSLHQQYFAHLRR